MKMHQIGHFFAKSVEMSYFLCKLCINWSPAYMLLRICFTAGPWRGFLLAAILALWTEREVTAIQPHSLTWRRASQSQFRGLEAHAASRCKIMLDRRRDFSCGFSFHGPGQRLIPDPVLRTECRRRRFPLAASIRPGRRRLPGDAGQSWPLSCRSLPACCNRRHPSLPRGQRARPTH